MSDTDLKLALGTAQFGLDYGINNTRGKIPQEEACEILQFCLENEMCVLDTAYSYGKSEGVIGQFIREKNAKFQIISKTSAENSSELEKCFLESSKRLNVKKIYGYLIHNFEAFKRETKIWDALKKFRRQGKVEKIGFSLYYPEEAEYLLKNQTEANLIQIPFSIFDQRFSDILPVLKQRGMEIHARSIFLQGLVFKEPDELDESFWVIKDKLLALQNICRAINIPLTALCINFTHLNPNIDRIVMGVDSLIQLRNNIDFLYHRKVIRQIYSKLKTLRIDNEDVIVPSRWHVEVYEGERAV